MPNCKDPIKEKLRREKISQIQKKQFRSGERVIWSKGKTIKTDERIKKLRFWLGKKNLEHSKRMKGKISWNKGLKGYLAGEKHYNWKGGKGTENNKIHGSVEYKNWRKSVFQRDNYTCQVCLRRGVYLEAHHKKPFNKFPNLRFVVENGVTLCRECHKKLKKISLIR